MKSNQKWIELATIEKAYQAELAEAAKYGFDVNDPAVQAQCRRDAEITAKYAGRKPTPLTGREKAEAERLLIDDTLE